MDFLRSTIKVLFYDISPNDIAGSITAGIDSTELKDRIHELLTHRERSFTGKEIAGLGEILETDWLGDLRDLPSFRSSSASLSERVFIVLAKFGEKVLNLHQEIPRVRFCELLRWADSARYVEENLLLIPGLVCDDLRKNRDRYGFSWANVIEHDNPNLNPILARGMADVHAHLYASTDVFEFNWIATMNHPEIIHSLSENIRDKRDLSSTGRRAQYDSVVRFSNLNLSLEALTLIAAKIRLLLYRNLIGESEEEWQVDSKLLFDPENQMNSISTDVRGTRAWLVSSGKGTMTRNGLLLDYLISDYTGVPSISERQFTSCYMIHHGERWLLYNFLKRYFGDSNPRIREFAPYVWLYVVIRSKIRREFVQTNSLVGFDNFQRYQRRKAQFLGQLKSDKLNAIAVAYAIQSAIGENGNNYIEGRITAGEATKIKDVEYWKSIFGNKDLLSLEERRRFTFVIHLLKGVAKMGVATGAHRYSGLHKRYVSDIKKALAYHKWQVERKRTGVDADSYPDFVGIDAAGTEIDCRPEVFHEYYAKANEEGIYNFTYHAGEDFYDILDGMRAIDEVIAYLNFKPGCRIGHALALATDPIRYYNERHNTMIIPAQELLDNLVWMKMTGARLDVAFHGSTLAYIESRVAALIMGIGYGEISMGGYYESLRHRCDSDEELNQLPNRVKAVIEDYRRSKHVIDKGREMKHITDLPVYWGKDVRALQEAMLDLFERKGIVVECNPTSNLRIGRFGKYSSHPVFSFHGIRYDRSHTIPVTINTDDKGVFSTSLYNEYSLIAAALYKEVNEEGRRKYSDREIEEYIETLVKYGHRSRFTIG